MTQAWKSNQPSGRKMVLLALCDNANDQGECYPSVQMIAQKCSMTERSVFNHIADLEAIGAIKRNARPGRSTIYQLDPCKFCTPENASPLKQIHTTPETVSPPPLKQIHTTPETVSPITIKEPSIEPSWNRHKRDKAAQDDFDPMAALLEAEVDEQTAKDWLQHRKAKKFSFAMTVIKKRKEQAAIAGISLDDALSIEVSRGWHGFEAEWVTKQQPRASPAYQTKQDQTKAFVDALTGRRNDQRTPSPDIIDINERPADCMD